MSFPVRVTRRTPLPIVPDGLVHGRFYEPGEIATGEAAKVVLEWQCGDEILPEGLRKAPDDDSLYALKVDELRERAAAAGVDAAGLKKAELIEALRAVVKPVA